jgi:hypothetical protein
MWRTTAQPTAAFLDLPPAPHAHGGTSLGKTSVTAVSAGSRILERLGIVGMGTVEPVILAALTQQGPDPASWPARYWQVVPLEPPRCRAQVGAPALERQLLSFDHLVGYRFRNGSGGLDYWHRSVAAPSVFTDEISHLPPGNSEQTEVNSKRS